MKYARVDFHNKSRIGHRNTLCRLLKFRTKNEIGNYTIESLSRIFSRLCLQKYQIVSFGYVPSSIVRIEHSYPFLDRICQLLSSLLRDS
jgi:hypothetical protein